MVLHHLCQSKIDPHSSSKRRLYSKVSSSSNVILDQNDCIWNNPHELDLLDLRKAPMMSTSTDEYHFFRILPSIRRLFTTLNARCPNLYRMHCSDSLRVLKEIICLTSEYLHVNPASSIPVDVLLQHEDYMNDYIDRLRLSTCSSFYANQFTHSDTINLRCFGQGIDACHINNEVNQTLLFCFEITSPDKTNPISSMEIHIVDPHECDVPHDIQYISTYNQGHTNLFSCSYTPIVHEGTYTIAFLHNNMKLIKYPFTVLIRRASQQTLAIRQDDQLLSDNNSTTTAHGKYDHDFKSRSFVILRHEPFINRNLLFQVV
jgi:hypothetical protein